LDGKVMIEWMHSRVAKWILRFLAIFLIISFAAWGIEDMIRPPSNIETVAEVDGTEISRNEVNYQFQRVVNNMRRQLGPNFDIQQAVQLGVLDQTVDQMINARLITLDARRLGLHAGDELIRQTIMKDQRFQGLGNQFDRNAFRGYLAQEGMPEGAFVATLREQIIRQQLASALGAATTVPGILQDTLFRYRNEQRVAEVVTIPFGKLTDIKEPSDSELADFHKKNPGLFTSPEYREVTTIYLDPDEVAKGIQLSEDRIKEEFEDRKSSLAVPERRDIEQALLFDEAKAKSLSQMLKQGQDFAKAVKEVTGKDPSRLGTLSKNELPDPSVAETAFALAKDTASEPVKSPLGWHILRITKIIPGKTPRLEDHRSAIAAELARETAIDDLIKLTGKLDDTLAGGATLEDAASSIGARVLHFPAVDADGRDQTGKPIPNFPKGPEFMERVLSASIGENSNVEETANGAFFVFRVDKLTPPAVRPLKEIRSQVVQAWKQTKVQSFANEQAEKLKEAAKSASSLAQAAKTGGRTMVTSKPFSRFIRAPGSPISSELSAALFAAKKGVPVIGPTQTGLAVAVVTKVIPAEANKNKAEAESLKEQLRSALTNDAISQYLGSLRKRYSVVINRRALDYISGANTGG
jgi:peptidyl-prolyl cis-trans isomerase D